MIQATGSSSILDILSPEPQIWMTLILPQRMYLVAVWNVSVLPEEGQCDAFPVGQSAEAPSCMAMAEVWVLDIRNSEGKHASQKENY